MRWEESVRPNVSEPFFASWVEQKHHCQAVLRKIKIFKKSESWNNSSLQPGCLWVLTFCWLLLCDAFCVTEGVAKAPVRQREARENANAAWQERHRHKQMIKLLILGAEWAAPFCGDGPWDFEYSLFKFFFLYFLYFSLSDTPPSMVHLLHEEFNNFNCQPPFSCHRITHNMVKPSLSDPSSPEVIQIWPKSQETLGVWGAGGVVSHQHWAKQWELQ